jgi:hypothetical protein
MTIKLGVALVAAVVSLSCDSQQRDRQAPVTEAASKQDAASPTPAAMPDRLAEGRPLTSTPGPDQAVRPVAKPLAQSASIEQQTEQFLAAPSQASPAQRPAAAARETLSPVLAQFPGVWIGWYVNRSIDAFRVAIDRNQALVLVLGEDWCNFCTHLIQDSLRCPAVQRYAGDAVFAYGVPSLDKGSAAIAGSLGIDAWPTITVLEPEARMLLERGRINGYFEASTLGEHLDTILYQTPKRRYEDQPAGLGWFPFVASLHAQSASRRPQTTANAAAGAVQRGLKHSPPEPRCR